MNVDYLLTAHGFGRKKTKDETPPPRVIGFTAKASGNDIRLTWTNPVDTDFVGVAIVKNTSNYPTTVYDGETIYSGKETSFTDASVEKAKYIYYRAFSYDYDNNYNTEDGQTAVSIVKGEQTPPSAPVLEKADYNSVVLKKYANYEYKVGNGSWQTSNQFENLNSNTDYVFYQRKKANEFYNASNSSSGLSVKTLKPPYRVMTAVIDQSNSNPLTCITYEDDARTMTKGSSQWDDFFGAKLVLFKNSQEVRDLKDSELNGLSPADGDVMVKFKRMGLNIRTVGDKVYVTMTEDPDDNNFKYYAHTRGAKRKKAFYLGAYLGFLDGGKLRSIRGRIPTGDKVIGDFRTYAQNNGSGYDLCGFYQITFLQAMYILKYGNLDSQTALGKGFTGGVEEEARSTGSTNGKGKDYGTTSDEQQMRFQFIEDFYGNRNWAIDGVMTDNDLTCFTTTENFNNTRIGYKNVGALKYTSGYTTKVHGTSELGFTQKEEKGSATTYYSDFSSISSNAIAFFGGCSNTNSYSGIFRLCITYSIDFHRHIFSGRLMFL